MAEHTPRYGHESPHLEWRKVLVVVAILVAAVAAAVFAIHFALREQAAPQHAQRAARPGAIPPGPRLQPDGRIDLAALRKEKDEQLTTYGWSDQAHAFARIPIERAMALYAQHDAGRHDSASHGSPATAP